MLRPLSLVHIYPCINVVQIYLDALTCGHTKKNGVGTRGEKNVWESWRCSNPLSLKESNHKM